VSLLLIFQKTVLLPDLRVSTILLGVAFFNDIAMVFGSAWLTHGASITQSVAAGSPDLSFVAPSPLLLLAPPLADPADPFASVWTVRALGLGDVLLPGLFLVFLARLDRFRDALWVLPSCELCSEPLRENQRNNRASATGCLPGFLSACRDLADNCLTTVLTAAGNKIRNLGKDGRARAAMGGNNEDSDSEGEANELLNDAAGEPASKESLYLFNSEAAAVLTSDARGANIHTANAAGTTINSFSAANAEARAAALAEAWAEGSLISSYQRSEDLESLNPFDENERHVYEDNHTHASLCVTGARPQHSQHATLQALSTPVRQPRALMSPIIPRRPVPSPRVVLPIAQVCAACGAPEADKACRGCGVRYCGKECQRSHWAMHKAECAEPLFRESSTFYHHYPEYAPEHRARINRGYRQGNQVGYFWVACLGYMIGLLLAAWALAWSGSPQPALLYVVPCVLVPVVLVAQSKNELAALWDRSQIRKIRTELPKRDMLTDTFHTSGSAAVIMMSEATPGEAGGGPEQLLDNSVTASNQHSYTSLSDNF
jgi:hypothetical protein